MEGVRAVENVDSQFIGRVNQGLNYEKKKIKYPTHLDVYLYEKSSFYGQRTRQGQIVQEQQIRRTKTISPACHFIKIGQIKWWRPLQIIFKRQAWYFFSSLHQSYTPTPPSAAANPCGLLQVDGTVEKCKCMADDDFLGVSEKSLCPLKTEHPATSQTYLKRHTETHTHRRWHTGSVTQPSSYQPYRKDTFRNDTSAS